MRPFSFEQPRTLGAAVDLLAADGSARILAGGTDLIIRLRDGSIRASTVVDIKRVAELSTAIAARGGGVELGGRVTMTDVARHPGIRTRYTALAEGAAVVGSIQIRNRATLAGNAINASPAADTTPALLVFGAVVVVGGPQGARRIPIDELFVRSGVTTLRPAEIVTGIELPALDDGAGSVHLRRTRRRGHDLASVTVSCAVLASGETRLAYGSVGPRPVLRVERSGVLADPGASDDARAEVIERLVAEAAPSPTSMRASPDYRLAMLRVLASRAAAIARARLAERPAAR